MVVKNTSNFGGFLLASDCGRQEPLVLKIACYTDQNSPGVEQYTILQRGVGVGVGAGVEVGTGSG